MAFSQCCQPHTLGRRMLKTSDVRPGPMEVQPRGGQAMRDGGLKQANRYCRCWQWHSNLLGPLASRPDGGGSRHAANSEQPAGNAVKVGTSWELTFPLDPTPMEWPTMTHRLSDSSDQTKVPDVSGAEKELDLPWPGQQLPSRAVHRVPIL